MDYAEDLLRLRALGSIDKSALAGAKECALRMVRDAYRSGMTSSDVKRTVDEVLETWEPEEDDEAVEDFNAEDGGDWDDDIDEDDDDEAEEEEET
jgi:hypothetical protein